MPVPSRVAVFPRGNFPRRPGKGGWGLNKTERLDATASAGKLFRPELPNVRGHAFPNVVLNKSSRHGDTHVTDTPRPWIDPLRRDVKGYGEGIDFRTFSFSFSCSRCTYVCRISDTEGEDLTLRPGNVYGDSTDTLPMLKSGWKVASRYVLFCCLSCLFALCVNLRRLLDEDEICVCSKRAKNHLLLNKSWSNVFLLYIW